MDEDGDGDDDDDDDDNYQGHLNKYNLLSLGMW